MLVLKRFKYLKGSSILESVIAITIISVCILVGFTIYINVAKRNAPLAYYKAMQTIELLTQQTIDTKDYEIDSYEYENYTITKDVNVKEEERVVELEWIIKTAKKDYSVRKIIPYGYE